MMKITPLLLISYACTLMVNAQTPTPPVGYSWILNEDMSDEFNGQTTLNTVKWHSRLPNWAGRVPAEFLPENIILENDMMHIKNGPHPAPHDGYTIGGGGIETKQSQKYGYFETRMKASRIRMSSTFWLNTTQNTVNNSLPNPDDGVSCGRYNAEIDIIECMGGGSPSFASSRPWTTHMQSNTHFKHRRTATGGPSCTERFYSRGAAADVGENVADNFHVYGAWWVNSNVVRYYIDGVLVNEVNPRTDTYATPLDVAMSVRMVTETYNWQPVSGPGYPDPLDTNGELFDETINKTFYDWIRSYSLEPTAENIVSNPDLETGALSAPWTKFDGMGVGSVTFERGAFEKFNGEYGAKVIGPGGLEQVIDVEPNTDYIYTVMAKKTANTTGINIGVKPVTGNDVIATAIPVTTDLFAPYELQFNSGNLTQVKIFASGPADRTGFVDNFSVIKNVTLSIDSDILIDNNSIAVYASANKLNITSNVSVKASIKVYTILGQELANSNAVNLIAGKTESIAMNMVNGVYIVKIDIDNKKSIVKKIVF